MTAAAQSTNSAWPSIETVLDPYIEKTAPSLPQTTVTWSSLLEDAVEGESNGEALPEAEPRPDQDRTGEREMRPPCFALPFGLPPVLSQETKTVAGIPNPASVASEVFISSNCRGVSDSFPEPHAPQNAAEYEGSGRDGYAPATRLSRNSGSLLPASRPIRNRSGVMEASPVPNSGKMNPTAAALDARAFSADRATASVAGFEQTLGGNESTGERELLPVTFGVGPAPENRQKTSGASHGLVSLGSPNSIESQIPFAPGREHDLDNVSVMLPAGSPESDGSRPVERRLRSGSDESGASEPAFEQSSGFQACQVSETGCSDTRSVDASSGGEQSVVTEPAEAAQSYIDRPSVFRGSHAEEAAGFGVMALEGKDSERKQLYPAEVALRSGKHIDSRDLAFSVRLKPVYGVVSAKEAPTHAEQHRSEPASEARQTVSQPLDSTGGEERWVETQKTPETRAASGETSTPQAAFADARAAGSGASHTGMDSTPHSMQRARTAPQQSEAQPARDHSSETPREPARRITLDLNQDGRRVEIRVSERAGEIRMAVRTPDPALAGSLRQQLPALESRFEETGFRHQEWRLNDPRAHELNSGSEPWSSGNSETGDTESGRKRQQEAELPQTALKHSQRKNREEFAWFMSSIA